ncbi:MAG: hypothetical protein JW749_04850 [Sedimentisphaerales bacterium]|nr:hypothetical protein [Sedimentisphaerales bacterium]
MGNTQVLKKSTICVFLFMASAAGSASALDAFPGAEGSGRLAIGGRGGAVYEVTNLNNSGSGSIVDAVSQPNRTIVFRISGTIALGSVILEPKSYTTIAGQTAPGDGICLKGRIQIKNNVHDIIIRYIRVRVDEGQANSDGDAIDIDEGYNIIIDHVTASYSRDEGISCQEDTNKVTVQWCIISEALTYQDHSYGSLIRGRNGQQKTYHHNLYAHNNKRNPRPGNYTGIGSDPEGLHFDFRNNIVYNWAGSIAGYNDDGAGYVSRYNFIGNDCIRGPESSTSSYALRESSPDAYGYFSENAKDGIVPTGGSGQWLLVYFNGFTPAQITAYKARSYLIPMEAVTTTSAAQAKIDVLGGAGASFPVRDIIDTRIVNDVLNLTGHSIATTAEQPEGAWPPLDSLPAPTDTDHDGMPDEWEEAVCLDPDNAADRNGDSDGDGYTNLEEYLNWLPTGASVPKKTDVNCDDSVDFLDFSDFAGRWLSSAGEPLYDERYDFSGDDTITTDDLSYIAQDWLTAGGEY